MEKQHGDLQKPLDEGTPAMPGQWPHTPDFELDLHPPRLKGAWRMLKRAITRF